MSDDSKTGRWTKAEHETFVNCLNAHGKDWKKIAAAIPTRTVVQVRTHAQKYFLATKKHSESSAPSQQQHVVLAAKKLVGKKHHKAPLGQASKSKLVPEVKTAPSVDLFDLVDQWSGDSDEGGSPTSADELEFLRTSMTPSSTPPPPSVPASSSDYTDAPISAAASTISASPLKVDVGNSAGGASSTQDDWVEPLLLPPFMDFVESWLDMEEKQEDKQGGN